MGRENWEQARRDKRRTVHKGHYATVNASGVIVLGRFTNEALGGPEAVHIFFDRPNNSLVLKKVHPRVDDAYPVKPMGRFGGRAVRAGQAADQFGLTIKGTIRFLTPKIEDDALILDLRETYAVGRGRSRVTG